MGQGSEHITQILAFVLDNLQVVSYKWLSRHFSISSNEAKRLLQNFVEQHGNSVEVVYAVSGWSKREPQCYSIQLVPKSKLQQTKDFLEGHVSSHVYSVQPCIPNDPAELWNAEFVQSEELFNEPSELNNCLRDNRFSAVSCPSIARKAVEKNGVSGPSVALKGSAPVAPSSSSFKPPIVQAEVPPASSGGSEIQRSFHENAQAGSAKDACSVSLASAPTTGTTNKGANLAPTKKKTTGANLQAGGSLANLWGRAKNRPKSNSPEAHTRLTLQDGSTTTAGETKPLVQTHDTSFGGSTSDDDAEDFARLSRGQVKTSGGRKRRVVFEDDTSDVEKDFDSECIVSLSSPETNKVRQDSAAVLDKKELDKKPPKAKLAQHDGKLKTTPPVKNEGTSLADADTNGKYTSSESSFKEMKDLADKLPDSGRRKIDDDAKAGDSSMSTGVKLVRDKSQDVNSGPKKRKVVKTRIDDRGREVTEVVWENEDRTLDDQNEILLRDTNATVKMEESKALADKSLASVNNKAPNAPPIPPSRANIKPPGKSAVKDAQQGKILSFFKKKA